MTSNNLYWDFWVKPSLSFFWSSETFTENKLFKLMVKKGHFGSNIYLFLWYTNDINPYPWILGENQKRGTVAERVCRKKNRAQRCIICIVCFCALDFSGDRTRWRSQKWHMFLFSAVYFQSDMPFEISIII